MQHFKTVHYFKIYYINVSAPNRTKLRPIRLFIILHNQVQLHDKWLPLHYPQVKNHIKTPAC